MENLIHHPGKKIFAFFVLIMVLTVSTVAWAKPYRARLRDSRVNTWIEKRFDTNRDGWLSPRERRIMRSHYVNRPREYRCDFNHNRWIDTRRERLCKRYHYY